MQYLVDCSFSSFLLTAVTSAFSDKALSERGSSFSGLFSADTDEPYSSALVYELVLLLLLERFNRIILASVKSLRCKQRTRTRLTSLRHSSTSFVDNVIASAATCGRLRDIFGNVTSVSDCNNTTTQNQIVFTCTCMPHRKTRR